MLVAFVEMYRLRLTVRESVVSDVVTWLEREVEEQSSNTSSVVLGTLGGGLDSLERDSDTNESAQHQESGKHEHVTTLEAGDDKSDDRGGHQTPAGVGEVDAGFD